MTEFLKDKFSSRPNSKEYRTGWDRTFGKETHAIDCDMDEDCMCGEGMETVVAVSGAMFEVKVTLESEDGSVRITVGDTRTNRGRQMANLRTGQSWSDPNPPVEICGECGDQRQANGNCPHCGADAE